MSLPAVPTIAIRRGVVLATALVLAAGCGDPVSTPEAASEQTVSLEGGTWVLTEGSVDGRSLTAPEGTRISLTVDDDQAGGTAACNDYGASVDVEGELITFDEFANTEMACGAAAMAAEARFLDALGRIARVRRDGDELRLEGSATTLTFELRSPVPTEDLVGTTWELDTLIDGDTVTTADGEATLRLSDDGTVTGSTGCRQLDGEYQIWGDQVQLTSWGVDGDCPQARAAQDEHVIGVLEGGVRVEIDGDRLTLISADQEGLGYTAR